MNQINLDTLDQALIKLVQEKKPNTVQQLVNLTKLETQFIPEQEIIRHIIRLQSQGKLKLNAQIMLTSPRLTTYLKTGEVKWYWITLILATATVLAVFNIQEGFYPLVYLRHLLGAIFVLFLPGYSLIKLLFPEKELDNIERTALSMGMSLALVPIVGLILNYTPLGIRAIPITLSILTLTIIFATAAIIREHQTKTK